ncbi:MAG TPA: FAD binding domain-containing protein [Anaerolineales bacterium]
MIPWNKYHLAQTVNDALEALAAPGSARLIGGGTDLLLDLQQGRQSPVQTLVDVTAIPEMTALEPVPGLDALPVQPARRFPAALVPSAVDVVGHPGRALVDFLSKRGLYRH